MITRRDRPRVSTTAADTVLGGKLAGTSRGADNPAPQKVLVKLKGGDVDH